MLRIDLLRRLTSLLLGFFLALCGAASDAQENPAPAADEKTTGHVITLQLPVDDRLDRHVRRVVSRVRTEASQKGQNLTLVLELRGGAEGKFGDTFDLADFLSGPELGGARTIAFVPKDLTGHGVLLALACDEIVMAPKASIGKVLQEGEPSKSVSVAYQEIAARRKAVPAAVVEGMLNPAAEILMVEQGGGRRFITAKQLDAIRKEQPVVSQEQIVPPGEPGIFTGTQARKYGFVKFLAEDKIEVLEAYDLPRSALAEDYAIEGAPKTAKILLRETQLSSERVRQATNQFQKALSQECNFIVLAIDSEGGAPAESMALAGMIAKQDPAKIRTVAWIEGQAKADAALIAFACDKVVATEKAQIGGKSPAVKPKDLKVALDVAAEIAAKKYRSPGLLQAMLVPEVNVFRYQRGALSRFLTPEQAEELPDQEKWQRQEEVSAAGEYFQTNGKQAVETYQLASAIANDFGEFKAVFGLEKDPTLMEPTWADTLIQALASPWVASFLLFVGIIAVITEVQAPGLGLGWIVGGVCFLLYFWSQFLGGTAGWLEVCLFVAGFVFLALEIFVIPGFGVFGLCGGMMILASLVLASHTFSMTLGEQKWDIIRALGVIASAGVGALVMALLLRRVLPGNPMFQHLMLEPPSDQEGKPEEGSVDPYAIAPGQQGTAITRLGPSGKAMIGERYVDVIAQGQYVERGESIRVVEVRGNRVVVKPAAKS